MSLPREAWFGKASSCQESNTLADTAAPVTPPVFADRSNGEDRHGRYR